MKTIRDKLYNQDNSEDPTWIYNKNDITVTVNLKQKIELNDTNFGSTDYKEWPAYKEMTLTETANSTIDWKLSDSVVKEL